MSETKTESVNQVIMTAADGRIMFHIGVKLLRDLCEAMRDNVQKDQRWVTMAIDTANLRKATIDSGLGKVPVTVMGHTGD